MRRKLTTILLVTGIAIYVVWDIYVAFVEHSLISGTGGTISEVTLSYAEQHPQLPYAVGGVCGHLFTRVAKASQRLLRIGILSSIAINLTVADVFVNFAVPPLAMLLIGLPLGIVLWPQVRSE